MLNKSLVLLIFAVAAAGRAEETSECRNLPANTDFTIERYYFRELGAPDDPLCTNVLGFPICSLKGTFYVPKRASEAPAVIVNHGAANNDKRESSFCPVIEYFIKRGFVVFVPLRRGYLLKETPPADDRDRFVVRFKNTGRFEGEVVDEVKELKIFDGLPMPPEAEPYLEKCPLTKPVSGKGIDCLRGELTHSETAEIREAVLWLKKQKVDCSDTPPEIECSEDTPLVDPRKVALLGHSSGAQVSIHSGADLTGRAKPQAVIAVSMAEKSWDGNTYVQDDLDKSAKNARVPFALMQPSNAKSLGSSERLGKTAAQNRKRYLAEIFPPVDVDGETDPDKIADIAHHDFFDEPKYVKQWGAVALFFMAIYGVE